MMYAVLCYHDEAIVSAWSPDDEAKVVGDLIAVHDKWGRTFRPVLRLMPTGTATSLSKAGKLVTDGPFAETKEQLLGIYTIEVADLEGAMNVVRDLAAGAVPAPGGDRGASCARRTAR